MPGVSKRNTITRIIFAATIVTGFLTCFILSCEIFDYERVLIVETGASVEPSYNSAVVTGQLIDLGEGEIIQHGHCWSEDHDPKIDHDQTFKLGSRASRGSFTSVLQGLIPDTKYYVRAFATNSQGTVYGKEEPFKTIPGLAPEADFMADPTHIQAGGSVEFTDLSSNNPTSWYWEFGDDYTSEEQNPSNLYLFSGNYTVSLTVSNIYGSDKKTIPDYIIVDVAQRGTYIDRRDDHEYSWVKIGEQIWMAENLAYLPVVFPPEDYSPLEHRNYVYEYYFSVPNEAKFTFNYLTYGVLYNWPAAMDDAAGSSANPSGVRGICPEGWHLPSNDEWFDLIFYVGDNGDDPFNTNAGGQLKEVGNSHWINPNVGATNTYGYKGLPGGAYFSNDGGSFDYLGSEAYWWSSDEDTDVYSWGLSTDDEKIHWYTSDKAFGSSVRCVKDGGSLKKRLPGKVDYKPDMLKPGK